MRSLRAILDSSGLWGLGFSLSPYKYNFTLLETQPQFPRE